MRCWMPSALVLRGALGAFLSFLGLGAVLGFAAGLATLFAAADTPAAIIRSVEIERGNLGATTVTLSNYLGAQPVAVESTTWAGLSGGLNPDTVQWPASVVVEPVGS